MSHGFCKVASDDESIPCKDDGRLKEGGPRKGAVVLIDVVEALYLAGDSTVIY